MAGLFKAFKNLFTYKEPKEPEGEFELLEDENEGIERENNQINWQKIEEKACGSGKDENTTANKPPLTVDEWNKAKKQEKQQNCPGIQTAKNNMVAPKLTVNIEFIKQKFNMPKNQDIILRDFNIAQKIEACLVFVDGMVDKTVINQFILPQLMNPEYFRSFSGDCPLDYIVKNVISVNQVTKIKELEKITTQVLNGLTALFIDGCDECLLIESRGFEKRPVDKPQTETVVKGSQEAFNENLRTNLTLIRRVIKNENLVTEIMPVGKMNKVNCAVAYLEGIANLKLINEVKKRLKNIDIDFIAGDGMIEQLIEENSFMLFPQVISTERPDRAASFIMEGKIVIICEGTPFALSVPVTFFHLFHTSEDSMLRWQYGTFLRLIRFLGVVLAALLPGMYIALTFYHDEMIPTPLLASIISARENVPFPSIIEILMMEVAFELIREGGIRIPGVIGQTLGIIGALILGQAAVAAGFVSPALIIIVAVSGLGSFCIPNISLSLAIRIIRFIFIFLGATLGFYGISLGITIIGAIACNMKSFGVPFFSPVAPKTKVNPDIFIRQPIWKQKMRPDYLNTPNRKRAGDNPIRWKNKKGNEGNT
ncbi:MAG: spore germination protein [Caulobacteraceae bacterium]